MQLDQPDTPIPAGPEINEPLIPRQQDHAHSKKIIILVIIIAVLVIVGVAWTLLRKPISSKPANNSSLTGISLQDNSSPVRYGGSDVIQACTILPQKDLMNAGYSLSKDTGVGTLFRTYFTNDGASNVLLGQLGFTVIGGPYFNNCTLLLNNDLRASSTVLQSSYIKSGSFSDYVANQKPQQLPDINGVKVLQFTDQVQHVTNYALISPDGMTGVDFYVESVLRNQNPTILQNAQHALLKIAAANLVAQSKKPTGSPTITYDRTFPASYAKACSLTSNSDFKAIYGVDRSPLLTESAAGAPGTTGTASSGKAVMYVDNECFIQSYVNDDDAILNPNPNFSLPDVQYLTVRTESYLDEQAASTGFDTARNNAKDVNTVNSIGDQAFFASSGGGLANPLIFRKGRFIIEIAPTQLGVPSQQSASQIVQELTPLGKKIASGL